MLPRLHYGTTAKVFHWLIVGLLIVQYLIGWLMPDVHRSQQPGLGMSLHISFGISILVLIVLRFIWRLAHPVAPESSPPAWQRLSSELVHWFLYLLVLATTVSGWLFASFRGYTKESHAGRVGSSIDCTKDSDSIKPPLYCRASLSVGVCDIPFRPRDLADG